MNFLAIIPARGGSQRLEGKNLRKIGGKTLVQHAIDHAIGADLTPYVSTDDDMIALHISGGILYPRAQLIRRPHELATPAATSLSVLRHAWEWITDNRPETAAECEALVLLQPTSPLRSPDDVRLCMKMMEDTNADSVVSITEGASDLAFHVKHAGRLEKINRPFVANGAVFILTVKALLAGHDWFSGEAYGYVMPKDRSIDIDTALDLEFARLAFAAQ